MKTLKLAIAAVMLIGLTVGKTEAKTALTCNPSQNLMRGVTAYQVIVYLQNTSPAHTVLTTPFTEDNGYTWHCVTSIQGIHYNTTVFTDGNNIVGFEDEPID